MPVPVPQSVKLSWRKKQRECTHKPFEQHVSQTRVLVFRAKVLSLSGKGLPTGSAPVSQFSPGNFYTVSYQECGNYLWWRSEFPKLFGNRLDRKSEHFMLTRDRSGILRLELKQVVRMQSVIA